jgi:AcrR family transcriptional regulator
VSLPQLVDPSAAPVRERGLRSRAGNAMNRTRAALLDGAVRAVAAHGVRRSTMADIASLAGVAKATLYNHFRTKEAVFAAVLDARVRGLTEDCVRIARSDLAAALACAAERIGSDPALRRIARDEPAVVASFARLGSGGVWYTARAGLHELLTAAGRDAADHHVELVLRWLTSFVATPGTAVDAQAHAVACAVCAEPAAAAVTA